MTYKVKAWTNQIFNAQPLDCYFLCLTLSSPDNGRPTAFRLCSKISLSMRPFLCTLPKIAQPSSWPYHTLFSSYFFVVLTSSWQYFENCFFLSRMQLERQSCNGGACQLHPLLYSLECLAHSRLSINIYWMKELINKGIYVLCILYFILY